MFIKQLVIRDFVLHVKDRSSLRETNKKIMWIQIISFRVEGMRVVHVARHVNSTADDIANAVHCNVLVQIHCYGSKSNYALDSCHFLNVFTQLPTSQQAAPAK